MSWESVEDIRLEFQLSSHEIGDIRAELVRKLAASHPDKTGGAFESSEDEARFTRLKAAIDWLDSRSVALVASPEVAAAIEKLGKRVDALSAIGTASPSRSEATRHLSTVGSAVYRSARIRSSVFACVTGAIMSFSQALQDNPLFSWIAESPVALALLISAFALSGAFLIISWIRETDASSKVSWLLSEDGLLYVVRSVLDDARRSKEPPLLSRRALARQAIWNSRWWHRSRTMRNLMRFFAGRLSTSVAEQIADAQLRELIARGVLIPAGFRGIKSVYRMHEARALELNSLSSLYYP